MNMVMNNTVFNLSCISVTSHITGYRRLFKQYVEKYKEKLLTSSPSADLLAELLVCR